MAKKWPTTLVRHIGVPKWIAWSQFRLSGLNGNSFCMSCRNLMKFGPVIPEFTKLECLLQAFTFLLGLVSLRSL